MDSPLIIIPAHNEEATIELVIDDLIRHGFKDILVVDDYSTDSTAAIAKQKKVSVLCLPYNIGAWKATQAGVRFAKGKGYEKLITFDADCQHLASELSVLIEHQNKCKANLVIGSCPSRGSIARHFAWKIFRLLSGVKIIDLTSGLRLYDKKAIEVLSRKEASLLEYQDVGVLLMLKSFNVSKSEVSVEMGDRTTGVSRIFYSWGAVAYYMGYTTMLCLSKIAKKTHLLP